MNRKTIQKFLLMLFIDIMIGIVLCLLFKKLGLSIFFKLNYTLCIIYVLKTLYKSNLFQYLLPIIGRYSPMITIPVIAICIFFVILKYYDPSTVLTKAEIISFYGSYLSFVGAFCLGYFIYRKSESSQINDKINKCKLLLNCLDSTDMEMLRVARYNYEPAFINYDPNWINYFYEYESLMHSSNTELKETLTEHFNTIDRMNTAITQRNYKLASEIYEKSIIDNCYSISKYNKFEAKTCILDACSFYNFGFKSLSKNWLEEPETKRIIFEYSNAYYPIIEIYVWNYMIKNNLQYTNGHELDREITDWLLTNNEFVKLVKFPSDKRIVSKIVFDCFLMIENKSKRLSYCWGEFSLK